MSTGGTAAVSLGGFLLTAEEWRDDDLRHALLSAWAAQASAAADPDSYESFEVLIEARPAA
jgi:hypothetical protein